MGGEPGLETPTPAPSEADAANGLWARVREHKIIQWGLAYLGAALALAHGAELLGHAFDWPELVNRLFMVLLIVGFPVALALAWYHGHRGLVQVGAGELMIISVLVLIGAVFFTAVLRPPSEHAAAASAPGVIEEGATRQPNSLAVVPFVNNSSDPEQEHFVDGLSAELINSLNRIRGLAVTGRTSSFTFKGKTESLSVIGKTLGVEYVLEGSVQRSGDRIRVTSQLVDTRTERQLWSEMYNRKFEDIFAIQDEITTEVAKALQITLGVGDLGRIPGMTRSVAAYEELLKANALWFQFDAEAMRNAIEHLDRAIVIDPSFSLAWNTRANVYATGSRLGPGPAESEEWRRNAVAAAERAKELTPDAPFVLLSEATARMNEGAWREAAAFFEKEAPTLATTPGPYISVWALRAQFLTYVGRNGDAIRYWERARAVEPLSSGVALLLGEAYASAGALDAALNEFDRGLKYAELTRELTGPLRVNALMTALASGDRDEIERRIASSAAGGEISVAMARFLDNPGGAAEEIRRLAAALSDDQNPFSLSLLATWAAYYDDAETALALLRRIPVSGSSDIVATAIWRPLMSDMRKLPGFKDLVRDMGLVDYWRKYGWSDFCGPVGDDDFACK